MRAPPRIPALILCLAMPVAAAAADERALRIPYQDPEAVAEGEGIYNRFCAACHGENRTGEPDWRRRNDNGYLPAPPHDASGHTWQHPDGELFAIVKNGVEAVRAGDYKSRMNGFGHLLSEAEILQVLAFIKANWPPYLIERQNTLTRRGGHGHRR